MDFDGHCENRSWGTVRCRATTDRHGNDVVLVVARVAYAVSQGGKVTLEHRPIRFSDVPDGSGGVRFPSDFATDKPGTDVGLVGTAYPSKAGAERHLAWVMVGSSLRKVVQLLGPRTFTTSWGKVAPGAPGPIEAVPLTYAHCFGGTEPPPTPEGFPTEEPHNPIGVGFATSPELLLGKPAPRLEPVSDVGVHPHPSHGCFAPLPPSWEPRRNRIGTRDASYHRTRAPVPPADFDPMFHSWAPPELHARSPLAPNEPIEVGGVLPEGTWRFVLPAYALSFGVPDGEDWHRFATHLDGILVDADARVVELTWRTTIPLPDPWEKLPRFRVWSDTPMPKEVLP
jgi:hypothetical protein